ncbi:hypothetical protein, partial [Klebsiella pneumoniae]
LRDIFISCKVPPSITIPHIIIMNFANLNSLSMLPVRLRHYQKTSNYRSGLLKVIPPTPSLEENFVQPEDYPNQPDNQQSNKYGDN